MRNDASHGRNILRGALGPTADCPTAEELARFSDGAATGRDWAPHIANCAHCSAEIQLLRDFQSGIVDDKEAEPVRQIAQSLKAQSSAILGAVPIALRPRWWESFGNVRRWNPVLLAAAAVLVFVGVGLEFRRTAPALRPPAGSEEETLRSNALEALSPSGDIGQMPAEFRWQPARSAVRYRVQLTEVDGHELWSADTADNQIELPKEIRVLVVPQKTLVWEVQGLDAGGRVVAESHAVRFRLLQNLYTR